MKSKITQLHPDKGVVTYAREIVPWTVERVKDELPDMPVLYQGKVYQGQLRGRKMDFPKVYFTVNGHELNAEWSWQTIVNCLNNGGSLRY